MKLLRPILMFCILLFFSCMPEKQSSAVPVYIQDYHTGSFYWLARHLSWNKKYRLILFDAHSDAYAVYRSEELKQDLKRAVKQRRTEALLDTLRRHNIIQCYNWLEPLLPEPIKEVIWVPPTHVDKKKEIELRAQIRRELCGRDPEAPAGSCALAGVFSIMDFEKLLSAEQDTNHCVVSIDLDYFYCMTEAQAAKQLDRILNFVFNIPGLAVVTVAISNIYLKHAAQGHRLLFLLLRALVEKRGMTVFFEPFIDDGEDLSREAREFLRRGETLPAYDIETAPDYLRRLLFAHRDRIIVDQAGGRWRRLLERWKTNN